MKLGAIGNLNAHFRTKGKQGNPDCSISLNLTGSDVILRDFHEEGRKILTIRKISPDGTLRIELEIGFDLE